MEIIYQYDGTFDGFLCCVFHSYVDKELPVAIYSDEEFFSLYEVRNINTIPENAQRVYRSIVKRSHRAADVVRRAFFTCLPEKEMHLLTLIRTLYAQGPAFLSNPADPACCDVFKALRHMNGELEKLRGFIRFSDCNGVLCAEIEPKNRVLPLLRHHFCSRYANESFFIYDRTHKELLLYSHGKSRITPVDHLQMAQPGDEEIFYRTLWKKFFDTVAIEERRNPRCQDTFLPKRYRGVMTEFLPPDYGASHQDLPESLDAFTFHA